MLKPWIVGVFAVCSLSASPASGATGIDRIRELVSDAEHAPSGEVQIRLRKLWTEWERTDPALIEEGLSLLATSPTMSSEGRAYAGLLHAYARRRRGDLEGAKSRITKLGYVNRWLTVGPFDNEGKNGVAAAFGPESESGSVDLGKTYSGKERPVRFRVTPDVFSYGWIDLGALMRPAENMCGIASTFVKTKKPSEISLWIGATGSVSVYFGGKEVLRDDHFRSLDADRTAVRIHAGKTWQRLSVKVCGTEQSPTFALRIADASGAPDPSIEVSADPKVVAEPTDPKPSKLYGPLKALEERAKGKDARAEFLLATYLYLTSGDDPQKPVSRELATHAAQSAPTIENLLLAGDLAENRNQRAQWVGKAEARVTRATTLRERLLVKAARASLLQSGPSPKDALIAYNQILELDRDHIGARLARAEALSDVGLRATAVHELEEAAIRMPRSVSILRALALGLEASSRTREAIEVTDRYAQLRFDDATFVRTQIDLSLARRDMKEALRWSERLLALAPDQSSSYAVAARTHLAFGRKSEGLAALRRAVELAPEDTLNLHALADAYALYGDRTEQVKLLRKILVIKPQEKQVREQLAHLEPDKPRADEAYARAPATFLSGRNEPARGMTRRTLVDLQVTTVFQNGLASRFHQKVFQPLSAEAAAEAREYAFAFEGDAETVQLRVARIHRANGQIDDASETGEADADNPGLVMYTSGRIFYVHFPRIEVGDVIELQYRVEDTAERNAFADYFGEVRTLQSTEPIVRAEYVLVTPKKRSFVFHESPLPTLKKTVEENATDRIVHYVAENVPALQGEPLDPPLSEMLAHVHVSTYQSWDDMAKWYWGLVKDQFVADEEVRKRVAEITKGLTDEKSKVRAVYDYVVQKTRYVALEFGIHGFKPYRCAQIFARGFGDCKDKATLIVTMLKELGIPSTIVIVRTGMRGDFETSPASLAPFDHAIAYVPSMNLYLDGTAEWTGSTELPAMDRGALALQINEGKPKLVHLPDPPASESVTTQRIEAALSADGSGDIRYSARVTGVSARSYRERYSGASTRKSRLTEDLVGLLSGWEIQGDVDAKGIEDIETPVLVSARGKVRELLRKDGTDFTIGVTPREYLVREYGALSTRKRDVRLSAQTTRVLEWDLKLPAGFRQKTPARVAKGTSPFGSYEVTQSTKDGHIIVATTIALTKTRILVKEYAAFRAFLEEADRALGQKITVGP